MTIIIHKREDRSLGVDNSMNIHIDVDSVSKPYPLHFLFTRGVNAQSLLRPTATKGRPCVPIYCGF